MKKQKLFTIIFSSICTGILLTSVGVGCYYAISKNNSKNNISNPMYDNRPVVFDNKTFNNYKQAYEYALNMVSKQKISNTSTNVLGLNLANTIYMFDNVVDLNQFINSNIKPINTTVNFTNTQLNLDNSIPESELSKYNIDIENNTSFSRPVNVFKNSSGGIVVDNMNDFITAQNKAKDSYFELHKMYCFNGIYFNSKKELEIYLRNNYVNICTNNSTIKNDYKSLIFNNIESTPINFNQANKPVPEVLSFVEDYSTKYLKLDLNSYESKYLKVDKSSNQILGDLSLIPISSLPVIKKPSTGAESVYIVDAKQTEEYNLYGPYFLKTSDAISNITNPDLWKESSDTPTDILKTKSLDSFKSFLDLFLNNDDFINRSIGNWGLKYNTIPKNEKREIFYLSSIDDELRNAEIEMLKAISTIKTKNNSTLYNDFKQMFTNLMNTKSYSVVFAIPAIYSFLINNIIEYNVPIEKYICIQNYFKILTNKIQEILEGMFGKELLKSYNSNSNKYFNFADFFGINQYGFDFSSIGNILTGNEFLKEYKALYAACFVYFKAIAMSQSQTMTGVCENYNVENETELFEFLSEGKNSDQNTAESIKETFKKQGIIDKLNAIFKAVFDTNKLCTKQIYEFIEQQDKKMNSYSYNNEINRLDTIINSLNQLDQNLTFETIDNNSNHGLTNIFNNLQNKLGAIKTFNTSNDVSFKYFKTTTTINSIKTTIKDSRKSILQLKMFETNNSDCDWKKSGSIFSSTNQKFSFKQWIENKTTTTEEIIVGSRGTGEISELNSRCTNNNNISGAEITSNFLSTIDGEIPNLFNTIISTVNLVKNQVFNQKAVDTLIASASMKVLKSLVNVVGSCLPVIGQAICSGISLVLSIIIEAIGTPEQKIYEYSVKSGSNTIKYYWDGGLTISHFWGLWKEEERTIKDLKMLSPIEIVEPSQKDFIYFNQKQYDTEDDNIVRNDAINYLMNHKINPIFNNFFNYVYSLETNPNDLNTSNTFKTNLDLAKDIINSVNNNTNKYDKYLTIPKNTIFYEGNIFRNPQEFKDKLDTDILQQIKPIYIAKLPKLNQDNLADSNQNEFHLPYPYFLQSNPIDKRIVLSKNEFANPDKYNNKLNKTTSLVQDQEYIIVDTNINTELTINEIKNIILQKFRSSFDIESKVVNFTSILNDEYKKFDEIESNLKQKIIYVVTLPGLENKYFIDKTSAVQYLMKIGMLNNSIKLPISTSTVYVYTNPQNNQKIKFNSLTSFNNWFKNSIKFQN